MVGMERKLHRGQHGSSYLQCNARLLVVLITPCVSLWLHIDICTGPELLKYFAAMACTKNNNNNIMLPQEQRKSTMEMLTLRGESALSE